MSPVQFNAGRASRRYQLGSDCYGNAGGHLQHAAGQSDGLRTQVKAEVSADEGRAPEDVNGAEAVVLDDVCACCHPASLVHRHKHSAGLTAPNHGESLVDLSELELVGHETRQTKLSGLHQTEIAWDIDIGLSAATV